LEPGAKLAAIFAERNDDYLEAYTAAFADAQIISPELFAGNLIEFLREKWEIDFLPYELDDIDEDAEKGKHYLRLMDAVYADEIEDVQAEVGSRLRGYIAFLQKFAPKLDFLNEISPDNYVRRPLERLWQMEPIAIFEDMSVSNDGEADALLDTLETNFTPVIPDVAATADRIRRKWFASFHPEDEREELFFYELIDRSVTHAVATESRMAATDWILRNFDNNALLVGILDICRRGLECLGMFCGNYKFMSEHRGFIEDILEGKG
jgi:hypothetical protein